MTVGIRTIQYDPTVNSFDDSPDGEDVAFPSAPLFGTGADQVDEASIARLAMDAPFDTDDSAYSDTSLNSWHTGVGSTSPLRRPAKWHAAGPATPVVDNMHYSRLDDEILSRMRDIGIANFLQQVRLQLRVPNDATRAGAIAALVRLADPTAVRLRQERSSIQWGDVEESLLQDIRRALSVPSGTPISHLEISNDAAASLIEAAAKIGGTKSLNCFRTALLDPSTPRILKLALIKGLGIVGRRLKDGTILGLLLDKIFLVARGATILHAQAALRAMFDLNRTAAINAVFAVLNASPCNYDLAFPSIRILGELATHADLPQIRSLVASIRSSDFKSRLDDLLKRLGVACA